MRLGFGFLGAPAVPEMAMLAQRAEALGYESIWVAETRLTRDAITPAAAIAASTTRILIATGCINVFTRGAVLVGITFLSLDELSGGRMILGIAAGSPLVLQAQGYAFEQPLERLREYVEVIRELLARGRLTYQGRTLQIPGAMLEVEPPRARIPVYLGVTGPRALELAGEIADGVLLNGFMPVSYVRRARERLAAGERRAARRPERVDVAGAIVASMDADRKVARDRVRGFLATYLTRFPNLARETGLEPVYLERLRYAIADGGVEAGSRLVTDEVIDLLVVAGSPEECHARIAAYRDAGLGLPVIFAVGPNQRETLEVFAPSAVQGDRAPSGRF
jgi:5,10-methylenetetrahydromethanopterin reductase